MGRAIHHAAFIVQWITAFIIAHHYGVVPGFACGLCTLMGILSGWTDRDLGHEDK